MADPGQRPKRISEEELAEAIERWTEKHRLIAGEAVYLDEGDGAEAAEHLFDIAHFARRRKVGLTV